MHLQVEPLNVEEVRWFYCTKKSKMKPMLGCDSIRLENNWRLFHGEHNSADDSKRVPIRGGMYEVQLIFILSAWMQALFSLVNEIVQFNFDQNFVAAFFKFSIIVYCSCGKFLHKWILYPYTCTLMAVANIFFPRRYCFYCHNREAFYAQTTI